MKKIILLVVSLLLVGSVGFAAAKTSATSGKTIVKFAQDVFVAKGKTVKDVVAIGGSISVEGMVLGDAVAIGGTVNEGRGAVIKGEIVEFSFPGEASFAALCTEGNLFAGIAAFSLLQFLAFLVLGVILVALFSKYVRAVADQAKTKPWKNLLFGLLAIVLFVPIIILLVISLVGIILIPVWIVVFLLAGIMGYFAVASLVGRKVLEAFKVKDKPIVVEAITGYVLLALVGLVPLIGWLIKVVAGLIGLGAVVLTKFGTN